MNHFMTFFDGWEEWKETLASRAYMLYGEQAECIVANAISEVLGEGYNVGWPMKNLWHGLTICTQAEADEKIPELLKVPGKRWLSIEPMLGPINLAIIPNKYALGEGQRYYDPLKRLAWYATNDFSYYDVCNCREGVDFVVVGCETGPHRRPCKLEWIQSIVDQCRAAGVLVFVKQIEIERRVSHDMTEWPESLRVRELPWKKEQF